MEAIVFALFLGFCKVGKIICQKSVAKSIRKSKNN